MERPSGLHGQVGIWGRDAEEQSSNYQELRNLVETVEEEVAEGHLADAELWLFTDNSTAESCFFRGGLSSKLLHELVLRLRKAELKYGFELHLVHMAGTRMIAQGTDDLSRGMFLEGVSEGKDMLLFVDLAVPAINRHPVILDFVQSWLESTVGKGQVLKVEEWFVEGHGIVGGKRDSHGVWIPIHNKNGAVFVWSPPPVIGDVALEECLKSIHKQPDAFHVLLIPRLFSPLWLRMFYKFADFNFHISPGSTFWPHSMHEPLFVSIALPLLSRKPWTLRRTPLLVGLERRLCGLPDPSNCDGGDILRELLRVPKRFAGMSEDMAHKLLHLPRDRQVPVVNNGG